MTVQPAVVVWCLPGMTQARLVVVDDRTDRTSCRSLDLAQLGTLRDAVEEAMRRVSETLA